MMWNPRLRAVFNTRTSGFIATSVRFKPSRKGRDAQRAAREFKQDWKLIAPSMMRKQLLRVAISLGFGLGQRVPDKSPVSGRHIFKLRPYWPGFASWNWAEGAYRVQTFDAGAVNASSPSVERKPQDRPVASPLLQREPASRSPWIVCEPFGVNSYRDALMHAMWRPWLGHEWGMRDQSRASEKHGIGIIKSKYPRGSGNEHKAALDKFERGLRTLGSEGVVPLEQRDKDSGEAGFDIEPFEFNGTGFQAISDTMNSNAVALAILLLGHNLTTEIKGGGSYAAAGVADYIRDDVKYDDGATEYGYAGPQLASRGRSRTTAIPASRRCSSTRRTRRRSISLARRCSITSPWRSRSSARTCRAPTWKRSRTSSIFRCSTSRAARR
jgi:hypothetical protein